MYTLYNTIVVLQMVAVATSVILAESWSGPYEYVRYAAYALYALLALGALFLIPKEWKGYRQKSLSDLNSPELSRLQIDVKRTVLRHFDASLVNFLLQYIVREYYPLCTSQRDDVDLSKYPEVYSRWLDKWRPFSDIDHIFSKDDRTFENKVDIVKGLRKEIADDIDRFFEAYRDD